MNSAVTTSLDTTILLEHTDYLDDFGVYRQLQEKLVYVTRSIDAHGRFISKVKARKTGFLTLSLTLFQGNGGHGWD